MSTDKNIDWNGVIKREAVGIGGIDLGEVYDVKDEYIVTQKGLLDKKWYHIPRSLVETFDGIVLRLKVTENELVGFEKTDEKKSEDTLSSFESSDISSDMSKDVETITVPLMAEDLGVKKNIAEDNVNIIKEPVKETKTVDITLTREEIFIERRPVKAGSYSNISAMQSTAEQKSSESSSIEEFVEKRTKISIPLKREEAIITRKPYVKEEVVVKKKPVTETKEVSEDVTHEKVDTSDIK
jgi:stress response protein YsnF